MEISKGAAGVLAAVCLTAGASGAYLVTRSDSSADHVPVAAAQVSSASPHQASPTVEESEALVSDQPATDQSATPSEPKPAVTTPAPAPQTPRKPAAKHAAKPRTQAASSARNTNGEVPNDYVAPQVPEPRIATPPTLAPAIPDPEPVASPPDPGPQFEELVISADSVIGLSMETSLTSERAQVEDQVTARVARDVKVGDRVAIPAGAQANGIVTLVERGGKMRDRARLGVRFTSIVLADGTRVPLETDTIIREGSSPSGESAAKIGGGAIGGAIIGGLLGGAKGAIIGSTAGAGAGTAAVMGGGRNPATLTSGAPVTVRLLKPATVTVEQ